MTCAPSEDSDQTGHPPSLIRVFAVRLIGIQGPNPSSSGQRRLRSDWAHLQLVGFVTMRLKFENFQCANVAAVYRCNGAGLVHGRANDCCSCSRCGMGGVLWKFLFYLLIYPPCTFSNYYSLCFLRDGSTWPKYEPRHDKTNTAKTQISLGIRPVWSVFAVRLMGS